jgi:hypothetical protein
MRNVPTALVGRFDRAFVARVALAFALMLPALPWQRLVLTDGVQDVSSQPLHDEDDQPPSPGEEPSSQSFESSEDDAVVHDRHVFVLAGLKLERPPVSQFELDSLHTRELERPPLHTA